MTQNFDPYINFVGIEIQSCEYSVSDYNWTSLDLIRRVEVDMSAAPWGAISMMKLTTQVGFQIRSLIGR